MAEELTTEQLFSLYMNFNRDFRKANPEVQIIPPSFEGFEFTMQRLVAHPEEKNKLIKMWKQGWAATQMEINEALSKINFLTAEGLKQYEEFIKERTSHLKFT